MCIPTSTAGQNTFFLVGVFISVPKMMMENGCYAIDILKKT
jgi:hypothetical protein